jgi:hypothetical protein
VTTGERPEQPKERTWRTTPTTNDRTTDAAIQIGGRVAVRATASTGSAGTTLLVATVRPGAEIGTAAMVAGAVVTSATIARLAAGTNVARVPTAGATRGMIGVVVVQTVPVAQTVPVVRTVGSTGGTAVPTPVAIRVARPTAVAISETTVPSGVLIVPTAGAISGTTGRAARSGMTGRTGAATDAAIARNGAVIVRSAGEIGDASATTAGSAAGSIAMTPVVSATTRGVIAVPHTAAIGIGTASAMDADTIPVDRVRGAATAETAAIDVMGVSAPVAGIAVTPVQTIALAAIAMVSVGTGTVNAGEGTPAVRGSSNVASALRADEMATRAATIADRGAIPRGTVQAVRSATVGSVRIAHRGGRTVRGTGHEPRGRSALSVLGSGTGRVRPERDSARLLGTSGSITTRSTPDRFVRATMIPRFPRD